MARADGKIIRRLTSRKRNRGNIASLINYYKMLKQQKTAKEADCHHRNQNHVTTTIKQENEIFFSQLPSSLTDVMNCTTTVTNDNVWTTHIGSDNKDIVFHGLTGDMYIKCEIDLQSGD